MKQKVVVGMSGGVDSSVAAYLLKEQGYDVIGVTMKIWQEEDSCSIDNGGCCGLSAVEDARRVADVLGIPYYVMDFRKEFKAEVIDNFLSEYLCGRTPNPCIVCNRRIKWEALLKRSLEIGAEYMATGHYANIMRLPNGRYTFKTAQSSKDQTYALFNLTQEHLAHTLMPVGQYTKDEIRKIAADNNLPVANKPDSQDICFVPDNDYASYISAHTDVRIEEGNFVDLKGNVLGRHKGITHYTVGQRKGLGLSMGHPVFVLAIRPDTNEVVIGENAETFTDTLYCNRLNFMAVEDLLGKEKVMAKIRYSHQGSPCTIEKVDKDTVKCSFDSPVRAVTPGQAVVFYKENYVYGGGIII